MDPQKSVTITNDILHHGADYTPYEGLEVTGWPVRVLVRGRTVTDGDRLLATKGSGTYLPRNRSSLIQSHGN